MRVWNYGEALDKVCADMDLTNELFLTDDEKVGIFNDAIQDSAAEIYKLGVEDEYFTKQAPLAVAQNTDRVSLPADIYANKIRAIIFSNGSEIYEVPRMRRRRKYIKMTEIEQYASDAMYQYDIENPSVATGYQLVITPVPRGDVIAPGGGSAFTIHYVREVLYIPLASSGSLAASRATKIDLPQFMTYIFAYVKAEFARKIPHPNLADFEAKAENQRVKMISSLTEQVPDDNTEVEPDMSHYWRST